MVIYAQTAKGIVQKPDQFKDTWKQLHVKIYDVSCLDPTIPRIGSSNNLVTIETFMRYPQLHQNLTLFMMGGSSVGKSEVSKLMCLQLAVRYLGFEEAYFIFTNTLDSLRDVAPLLKPGVPVLFDEIGGAKDDDQLIFSSVTIYGRLFCVAQTHPNVVAGTRTLRLHQDSPR